MKPSTRDKIEGKIRVITGKIKQKAGKLTGNPNMAADGQDEVLAGKVQQKVGQVKKVFGK